MSIIPEIARPTIAPNRSGQIAYDTSLHITEEEIVYGTGDFVRLFWSNDNFIGEVRVDGTVWAASNTNVSAAFAGFYVQHFVITGTVVAEASEINNSGISQGNAYAISNSSAGQTVTNLGTIFAVTDHGLAQAISHWGPNVQIINAGLIAAQTGDDFEVASTQPLGIVLHNGGFIHNQVDGQILSEGINATGIIMSRGRPGLNPPAQPNILNDGVIHAVSTAGAPSVGILVANLDSAWMTIENNGRIEADVAIRTASAAFPDAPSSAQIYNNAGGLIRGDIEGDLGTETLINQGRIEGNVSLGEGADFFDNSQGEHSGWVSLDWGNDIFIGGAGAERVDGGRMDDKLSGGGGDDLLLGGMGGDRLEGGAGNDGLYGDYGDDTLIIAGGDAAFGGHGADLFEVGDLTFAMVDGGEGVDTLSLASIGSRLDLGQALASGRVAAIEVIDLGTAGAAAIDAADAGASLDGMRIAGKNAAELTLSGNWSADGQTVIDGVAYATYSANGAAVHVAAGVAVTLAASMPGDAVALDAVAGGAAAPTLNDEPTFALADPVWNNAFYNVTEDTVVGAYEIWRAGPGNLSVTSAFAREATFTNYGRLETEDGRAVSVDILRSFLNFGTIISGGADTDGYAAAFRANQTVPLFNFGSITAVVDTGLAEAAMVRAHTSFEDRGFENAGTIGATATSGEAVAIYLLAGGTNANSGEIYALGRDRATALYIERDMDFTNSGTIEADLTGEDVLDASAAIYIASTSFRMSLTNSGDIIGEYAIRADNFDFGFYQGTFDITNEASGQISGLVVLADTDDSLINAGSIVGDVSLGAGNDIFDSREGSFAGALAAGDGVDWVHAGAGDHAIDGGSNVDTAAVSGNRADYTITQIETGVFEVNGADGTDTLTNVEYLQFDDEIIRLRPGDGVAVDFETADPGLYQDAMNAIRDFDGNALGGDGSWLRIGSADVNGDGDVDQILVNDAIGRFATVGTDESGLVYFDDHSWAGETRVAGIYIDPLVQSGDVVAGSANDSQRRFQNDLEIENINRVLGANDYDGDGIWEVYFALTDGTAYLRALMHEDGNIRYANYQSEQEVIDYLTANGFDETTFGDWFTSGAEGAVESVTFVSREDVPDKQVMPEPLQGAGGGSYEPPENDIEYFMALRPADALHTSFDLWQAEVFG